MKRWYAALGVGVVALCVWATPSSASPDDSLQCGDHLVRVGETLGAVLLECGQPTAATHRFVKSRRGRGSVDVLTYERDGSFPRVLSFDCGALTDITILSRFRD